MTNREDIRHPNIKALHILLQRRLNWQVIVPKIARQPRMPRVRNSIVITNDRSRLCSFFDTPEWAVLMHVWNDEESAVLLDVLFREFLLDVDGLSVVIFEVALEDDHAWRCESRFGMKQQ